MMYLYHYVSLMNVLFSDQTFSILEPPLERLRHTFLFPVDTSSVLLKAIPPSHFLLCYCIFDKGKRKVGSVVTAKPILNCQVFLINILIL
jgi:hypothetical protein